MHKRRENNTSSNREILEAMGVGMALYRAVDDGQDFIFLELNPAGERICQIRHDEVVDRRVTEAFPGVEALGLLDVFKRVWREGRSERLEARVYQDTRLETWVENAVSRLSNGEIVAIFTDVSARKRVEAALARSEEKLQLFIRHAPVALAMFDRDMRYLAVSERWVTDYSPGLVPLVGRLHYEVFPDLPERWKAAHRRGLAGETVRNDSDHFVDADGTMHWVRWEVRPWHEVDDSIGGIVVFLEDITARKEAETALHDSEERLKSAQSVAHVGSWHLDLARDLLEWSDETYRIFGIEPGAPLSYESFLACIPDEDRAMVDRAWQAALLGAPYDIEHRIVANGETRWVREHAQLAYDDSGRLVSGIGTVQDITRSRQSEESLRVYANIFEKSGEAILVTDRDQRIIAVNPAFTRLTGYTFEEVRGRNPSMLSSGGTSPDTYRAMWGALLEEGFWQGELWDRRKDGAVYPKWATISAIRDDQGEISHYMASFSDITDRKAAEARIDFLAHHDPLTGLANRFSLESRLEQTLLTAQREGSQVAVMFVDMDHFKVINDTLGHHVGDRLLEEVARRLLHCVRGSDIIARLGGDEFVLVLPGIASPADAVLVAEKALQRLTATYALDEHRLHSSASIGISLYPGDGADSESLMKHADAAMYHAKNHGRNNYQFFTAAMNAAAEERLLIERELRVALEHGQLELHYQPQLRSRDDRVCGVEALARWRHPQHGLIPPARFIPIAEESGLIDALGHWVLDEACRQLAAWRAAGIALRMAVNLSARQLRSLTLVDNVRAALQRHGVAADDLELEITESAAMADPEHALLQLQALRGLGVRLAIDDFGTGHSSLTYLKRLPIQTLKLDRSFVRDIETDSNDAAISVATLALAHSLGIHVVAEGVETEAQRHFLQQHQCEYLQGYLLGRPEPAAVWSERWRASPGMVGQ